MNFRGTQTIADPILRVYFEPLVFPPKTSPFTALPTSDNGNSILPLDQRKISRVTTKFSCLSYTPLWIHQDIQLVISLKYIQCLPSST